MEEGFIEDIYKRFIKLSDLNPLLLYDMTLFELITYLEVIDEGVKEELEMEANVIRVAVNSALSGKPLKLFEEKAKSIRRTLEEREKEMRELDELGI